ncbi:MAG: type II secretion system F family protein [Coprococcus sp.]|nr:type II secretion system F family protein [Coprococcus sp.]
MLICAGMYLALAAAAWLIRRKKLSLHPHEELVRKIFLLLFLVTTTAVIVEAAGRMDSKKSGSLRLERSDYGGSRKEEQVEMQIEGEDTEDVAIQVFPRIYGTEEVEKLKKQAMTDLEKVILGDNESADYVEKDLYLPDKLEGYPFSILWELGRYDVVDMTGRLNQEAIMEEDPNGEGILVLVTGILRYEGIESAFQTTVRVFAGEKEEEGIRGKVLRMVSALEEESREDRFIELPVSVDGKSVRWRRSQAGKAMPILLLGMIGSVLLICLEKEKKSRERKDRNEQMLLDYPEIISQFTMLMGAGMTSKNVWKKIAVDYQEKKKETGRERAAYEEILAVYVELKSGVPEAECYERFARRCGLVPYMKLGVLLAQNLKKGTKGISEMLQMEAVQAMEERKSRAKRLGEEAGTKLLAPMLLMLIIVLTIVVVPAFLSIQL